MAGNPILENNTRSPEIVLGYPQNHIVFAVPEALRCHGEAAVCEQSGYAHYIMEHLSPESCGI